MTHTIPGVNRRGSPRHPPKRGSRLYCVTGKFGLGPNVALSICDLSETGIRMVLKTPLSPGHKIEIGLEALGDRQAATIPAEVIWCVPLADGTYCLSARFHQPLNYAALQSLSYF